MEFRQTTLEVQQAFDEVAEQIKPSVVKDSAENHKLIATWLQKNRVVDGKIDVGVGSLLSCYAALDKAGLLDWEVKSDSIALTPAPQYDYPEVPPGLDFVRTMQDIRTITQDGRLQKVFKGPHRDALNARVNYILSHRIGADNE
jgi:hypothetical protein